MQYIVNAKLVLEHGIVWDGVLGIEDGRIALCGPARSCEIPRQAECIDAQGLCGYPCTWAQRLFL